MNFILGGNGLIMLVNIYIIELLSIKDSLIQKQREWIRRYLKGDRVCDPSYQTNAISKAMNNFLVRLIKKLGC